MEKIEFTNPESKEFNEEVRNYLELMRDTEALIGDGMEKLKGANWAKLWSSLDKLVFYPKTYEGNLAIFRTRYDIRYVSLFTKPAFCCDQEADFELGGILRTYVSPSSVFISHACSSGENSSLIVLMLPTSFKSRRPSMNFGDMPFLSIQIRGILRL